MEVVPEWSPRLVVLILGAPEINVWRRGHLPATGFLAADWPSFLNGP